MKKKNKTKKKLPRGEYSSRLKHVNRYGRLRWKLDSDSLLKFKSYEGTGTVPSPLVTEMITALFNRNFKMDMDEVLVRKFAVQLLSMLGILSIYNSDRRVCLDRTFQMFCYPERMINDGDRGRYVFSLRTVVNPKHLSSYLHDILFKGEVTDTTLEEEVNTTTFIEELFTKYYENLLTDSEEKLNS